MIRPLVPRLVTAGWLLLAVGPVGLAHADPPAPAKRPAQAPAGEKAPGMSIPVPEPITSETIDRVRSAARQFIDTSAARGVRPVLVFDFEPVEAAPDAPTKFGAAFDLATMISTEFEGAGTTVAYVPRPLKGYAVLAALACEEVVMGTDSSLGPITPEGQPVNKSLREPVRGLALRRQRDPDLLLGMLDREADLRVVRADNKQLHYVLAENLPEFKRTHQIVEDEAAWEGGNRGVLSAARAREQGLARLFADSPEEVGRHYNLSGPLSANNPTLGQALRPLRVQLNGPVDSALQAYVQRRIAKARQARVNLIFFEINSAGGLDTAADAVADAIAGVKDMQTVAYVEDRATGVAALLALACNDIVFRKGAVLGDVHQIITGRNGQAQEIDRRTAQSLAGVAAHLAEERGHPAAVARAMVDPDAALFEAKDTKTGAACFVLKTQIEAEPERFVDPLPRKEPGAVLAVTGAEAAGYGLGQVVDDFEGCKALYGLRGKPVPLDGQNWVESLIVTLTDPFVSWLLLFVGLFMLVLELKLPGIGLPAITSALAFLLFFWSHYLSGKADELEIILFLVGMVCLALELFVFPGVGVFGMSGVLLVLTSIVMASHTFIWPTQEYEYREMGYTLIQVTVAMVAVCGGAVVLARYFPSLPLFNRLVLKPEPWTGFDDADPAAKPAAEGYDSLAFLVGESGRTTTVLRPSGKARFGELLIDVTADGFYIEPDSLVEVVDVQGAKVIVKRIGT